MGTGIHIDGHIVRVMKPDTWFPFYAGDYLRDTLSLTTIQHGAYLLLLLHAFTHNGTVPNDADELAAIAKMSRDEWEKNSIAISKLFKHERCHWVQKRVKEELEVQAERHKKRVTAGKIGASVRWCAANQPDSNAIANAQHCQVQVHSRGIEKGEGSETSHTIPPLSRAELGVIANTRGITQECVDWFWNTYDARGWVDRSGTPIRKPEALLQNAWATWQAKRAESKATQAKPERSVWSLTKRLEAIDGEIAAIKARGIEDAMGWRPAEKDRARLKELKAKRKEVNRQLQG